MILCPVRVCCLPGGGGGGNSRPAPTVKRGDMVTGTVVSVLGFGAFIKLPDGTQALLHVSEMRAPEGTVSPQSRDLVKLEEELEVQLPLLLSSSTVTIFSLVTGYRDNLFDIDINCTLPFLECQA